MPTREELQEELAKLSAHDVLRRRHLEDLASYTERSTILYASAFTSNKLPGIPGYALSISAQDVPGFMSALHGLKGKSLDLILHSPGGSLEGADQIVQYLRSKFDHIRAIVPQNAMSAATMIACACDEIVMGKHSALGPIDPQITFPTQNRHFTAPAHAILAEFENARQDIIDNPRTAPLWISKINTYPAGFLNMCRDTIQLAEDKVAEWLEKYMFADATADDPTPRKIAKWLADASEHKTHGRPISIEQAKSQGLRVVALEDDQNFQEKVLSVFHSTALTFDLSGCVKIIENSNGKGTFLVANSAK